MGEGSEAQERDKSELSLVKLAGILSRLLSGINSSAQHLGDKEGEFGEF